MKSTKKTITIVHLIYRFDIGGLERVMVNCINAMPEDKYQHVVVALTDIGEFSQHLNPSVKTYQLNKKSGKDLASHWRLFKLLRQIKPDILHSYNLAAVEYHLVAKLAGVKGHIHAEHGREINDPLGLNKKHNLLRKLLAPLIHFFVPVSTDLKEWLTDVVGIEHSKVKLIRNGIDTKKFSIGNAEFKAVDSDRHSRGVRDRHSRGVRDRHSRGVLIGNPELKAVDSGLSYNRNDDGRDNQNELDRHSRGDLDRHSRGVLIGNPELKAVDSGLSYNRNDDGRDNLADNESDNRNDNGRDNQNELDRHSRGDLDRHSRGVLIGNPELKVVDSGLSDNRNDDGCDNLADNESDNRNDDVGDNKNDLDRHSRGVLIGNPERCVRFIHIARFNPVKDQANLIQAFAELVMKGNYQPKQVRLTMVGDGELERSLKSLVNRLKLSSFVIFTGARNDIPELLSQADVFVLSSIAEGIPMTVLEAMAASLPIIATDVGGLSELVENGKTGLLVEKQNAEVLAKAMQIYIDNPQLIAQQGEQGHQFVEQNFSETNMVREYLILYNKSLGQN